MTLPLALTSLAPNNRIAMQQRCVESWRAFGLKVYSFNHPTEIETLAPMFPGVEFVPVETTEIARFGRHYIPLNAFFDWGMAQGDGNELLLIINSDIELSMTAEEFEGATKYAEGGLWIFVRYDYPAGMRDTAFGTQLRQCEGIDGFIFRARHGRLFPHSWLCLGQPAWDFWLPLTFMNAGHPVWSTNDRVALHELHTRGWSMPAHAASLKELASLLNVRLTESIDVHWHLLITAKRRLVSRGELATMYASYVNTPADQVFGRLAPLLAGMPNATALELGACDGKYTERLLSLLPTAPAAWYAFECDRRNVAKCRSNAVFTRPGIHLVEAAVGAADGEATFHQCSAVGQEWSESSSLCAPTDAMAQVFNWLRYNKEDDVTVPVRSLDSFTEEHNLESIDLIWADIEGAERLMVEGGQKTLARTKYLYTEVWDRRIYTGSWTYPELLANLPGWAVVERFPGDVLLRNVALTPVPPDPVPPTPITYGSLPQLPDENIAPFWTH